MSINNAYIIKEHNGKWYGWDEMAEESLNDDINNPSERVLQYSKAPFTAETEHELRHMMEDSYWLSAEYGFSTDFLPKDGTPIRYEE